MNLVFLVDTSYIQWTDIKHNCKLFKDTMVDNIKTLRSERDRCNSLIGRMILFSYLKSKRLINNCGSITIDYSNLGKPIIKGIKNLHFSISHSSHCVVCAISVENEIGVDVETIKKINIHEYKSVFTDEEFFFMINSKRPILAFYTLWTLKEALLKAIGLGFNVDPQKINVLSSPIIISSSSYYLKTIILNENSILSTCTLNNKDVHVVELSINDILD